MGDNRKATVTFASEGNNTRVTIQFESETENPIEMQQQGWQAILNNFKSYCESV